MSSCKPECLKSVADSASIFLEERKLDAVIRESQSDRNKAVKSKIHIPGASIIYVTFDPWYVCNSDLNFYLARSPMGL